MTSPEAGAKPATDEDVEGAPKAEATAPGPEVEVGAVGAEASAEAPRAEEILSSLSPENESLFSRTSTAGREFLREAYDKVENTGVVGRMALAYHGFFARRHEDKALKHQADAEKAGMQISALEDSKGKISELLQELDPSLAGTTGQLQSRAIDDRIRDLAGKKDKSQSAFEAAQNRAALRTNERDRVADKLIGGYDEKIKPLEFEISGLQEQRDKNELLSASTEARHEETLLTLGESEAKLRQQVAVIERAGLKLNDFPALKMIEEAIASGRQKIKAERSELDRRRLEVEKKIAKAEEKANPHRDKRENFIRIKQGRPIEISVPKRVRLEDNVGPETVRASTRRAEASFGSEAGGEESGEEAGGEESGEEEEEEEGEGEGAESGSETGKKAEAGSKETGKKPERPGKFGVELLVSEWNAVLSKEKKLKGTPVMIDSAELLKATKLKEDTPLKLETFRKILELYYRVKKVSVEGFVDKFTALSKRRSIVPRKKKA